MADNKTQENDGDVAAFLGSVQNDRRREDAQAVLELMQRVSGREPKMWGNSIVGFGSRHMVYDSGRELDWFDVGFSPRKQSLTVYLLDGFGEYEALLGRLGNHSTGKSCLYIKRLDEVDIDVLEELVRRSVDQARAED